MTEKEYLHSLGAWECEQDNPHHCMSVGGHTEVVVAWCEEHHGSDEVIRAAWLHDCGKMKTKVKRLKKGRWIDTFYSHAPVSASLAKEFGESEYVVALILHHDLAIGSPSDKTLSTLAKYGRSWCEDLALLMRADLAGQSQEYCFESKL